MLFVSEKCSVCTPLKCCPVVSITKVCSWHALVRIKAGCTSEPTPSVRQMVLVPMLVIIVLTGLISSLFHLPLSDNNRRQSNYSFIMKITRIALVIVLMYGATVSLLPYCLL